MTSSQPPLILIPLMAGVAALFLIDLLSATSIGAQEDEEEKAVVAAAEVIARSLFEFRKRRRAVPVTEQHVAKRRHFDHFELYNLCENGGKEHTESSWNQIRTWISYNKDDKENFKAAATHQAGRYNETPLHLILTERPPLDVVEALVKYAPDILQIRDDHGSLLIHDACEYRVSVDMLRILVEAYPESVKEKTASGWLPLHYACWNGASLEMLNFLTESYPESIDAENSLNERPSDIFKQWAQGDDDSNDSFDTNRNGRAGNDHMLLLHRAVVSKLSVYLIKLLINAFPKSCMIKDDNGMIPLQYACANIAPNTLDSVMLLLDAYPEGITAIDRLGRTPLHYLKAMACHRDENGMFPMHYQMAYSRYSTANCLNFLFGAYPESISLADNHGMLPFHHACLNEASSLDVLVVLIKFYPECLVCLLSYS